MYTFLQRVSDMLTRWLDGNQRPLQEHQEGMEQHSVQLQAAEPRSDQHVQQGEHQQEEDQHEEEQHEEQPQGEQKQREWQQGEHQQGEQQHTERQNEHPHLCNNASVQKDEDQLMETSGKEAGRA